MVNQPATPNCAQPGPVFRVIDRFTLDYRQPDEIQDHLWMMFHASLSGGLDVGLTKDEVTDLATTYRHISLLLRDTYAAHRKEANDAELLRRACELLRENHRANDDPENLNDDAQ